MSKAFLFEDDGEKEPEAEQGLKKSTVSVIKQEDPNPCLSCFCRVPLFLTALAMAALGTELIFKDEAAESIIPWISSEFLFSATFFSLGKKYQALSPEEDKLLKKTAYGSLAFSLLLSSVAVGVSFANQAVAATSFWCLGTAFAALATRKLSRFFATPIPAENVTLEPVVSSYGSCNGV